MADNFYYVEGSSQVKDLVKTLVTEITQNAGIYKWSLVYPSSINDIGVASDSPINIITDGTTPTHAEHEFTVTNQNDKCILKATTSYGKSFYLKIDRQASDISIVEKQVRVKFNSFANYYESQGTALDALAGYLDSATGSIAEYNTYVGIMTKGKSINNLIMQISDKLNTDGDDIVIADSNYNHRLSWYRQAPAGIKDFLPVQYWLNVTKDSVNIVLRGDPSADVAPYDNYLTSYAYIGALTPVEDSATTDDKYNFGITTGSDIEPSYNQSYGERTATGITDVCMMANKIGLPYQPHFPAFYSTNPFMDKCNVEGSRWNHKKHQFSDITLVHPVDMERGKMINVLAGDASSIYDADKLAYKKDTAEEEYYKKFTLTAPYNFLNNSANINYAIAIRCYKTSE